MTVFQKKKKTNGDWWLHCCCLARLHVKGVFGPCNWEWDEADSCDVMAMRWSELAEAKRDGESEKGTEEKGREGSSIFWLNKERVMCVGVCAACMSC